MIGILTFQDTTNYGAALQAYALMKVIQNNGYKCEIINYKCPAIQERYKTIKKYDNFRAFIKGILLSIPNNKLKKTFNNFYENKLLFSDIINPDSFEREIHKYKHIIVGSDQVWNPKLTGNDKNYFIPYKIQAKKIAYAASFGGYKDKNYIENVYSKYIREFDSVSLREMDSIKYSKSAELIDIKNVLDPTFLLEKKEWEKLFSPKRLVNEPYILVYKMMDTDDLFDFARRISKITGFKIIYITHSIKYMPQMENIFVVSPENFINYFWFAEYIITSSFHGVALSINLNKEFYYSLDQIEPEHNSRINSIINLFELQYRYTKNFNNEFKNINWKHINCILQKEREKSINYLLNSIEK